MVANSVPVRAYCNPPKKIMIERLKKRFKLYEPVCFDINTLKNKDFQDLRR